MDMQRPPYFRQAQTACIEREEVPEGYDPFAQDDYSLESLQARAEAAIRAGRKPGRLPREKPVKRARKKPATKSKRK